MKRSEFIKKAATEIAARTGLGPLEAQTAANAAADQLDSGSWEPEWVPLPEMGFRGITQNEPAVIGIIDYLTEHQGERCVRILNGFQAARENVRLLTRRPVQPAPGAVEELLAYFELEES